MKYLLVAYLDPTAGSIGYQVLISGLLAAAATLRFYWGKVRSLFSGDSAEGREEKRRENL